MAGMFDRWLVFRIAGVGFALALEHLVEIREAGAGVLDRSAADPEIALLGLLDYRDEAVHAINVRQKIGLPAPESFETAYLVVNGSDGIWAMPVDRVEGIFPAREFRACEVPVLLRLHGEMPYPSIQIWRSEPLVTCEPQMLERFGDAA